PSSTGGRRKSSLAPFLRLHYTIECRQLACGGASLAMSGRMGRSLRMAQGLDFGTAEKSRTTVSGITIQARTSFFTGMYLTPPFNSYEYQFLRSDLFASLESFFPLV